MRDVKKKTLLSLLYFFTCVSALVTKNIIRESRVVLIAIILYSISIFIKKNCQWAFKTQNHYKVPFSQLTYFLNLNCTLYGCGCRFTPGIIVLGSNFGKVSPVGLLIVQVCIKLTRNKKALFFPNNSPRQDRLPYPNGISLQRLEYNVHYYVIWKLRNLDR